MMKEYKYNWVQELQKGDLVIVRGSGFNGFDSVGRVDRTTKTQIIVKGTLSKFKKDTGRTVGGGIYFSWLEQYTKEAGAEIRKQIEIRKFVQLVNRITWDKIPYESIQRISVCFRSENIEAYTND